MNRRQFVATASTAAEAALFKATVIFLRLCFVHYNLASLNICVVQLADGSLRFFCIVHFYKCKTFATAREFVG